MRALLLTVLAGAVVTASALPASAHPHVWVSTRAELIYAPDGTLTSIRHAWTFDEGYSAYVTQGMAEGGRMDPVQAREIARTNVESLAESGYFTVLRVGGAKQDFEMARDAELGLEGKRLTLTFTLPLKAPPKAGRLLLDVYDPTFFVDFTVADRDAVRLSGAPAGCSADIQRPKPDTKAGQGNLSEAFFEALVSADVGARSANSVVVTCR